MRPLENGNTHITPAENVLEHDAVLNMESAASPPNMDACDSSSSAPDSMPENALLEEQPGDTPLDAPEPESDDSLIETPDDTPPNGGNLPAYVEWKAEQKQKAKKAKAIAEIIESDAAILTTLVEGGKQLTPEWLSETVTSCVESAMTAPQRPLELLGPLLSNLQKQAPNSYHRMIAGYARNAQLFMQMNVGADKKKFQIVLGLRAELIGELGLKTAGEFILLDRALCHLIQAWTAQEMASKSTKPSERIKLLQVAQGEDKVYAALLQQLRTRHQMRLASITVGAGPVAIQVNAGQPQDGASTKVSSPAPTAPCQHGTDAESTHLFDKNWKRTSWTFVATGFAHVSGVLSRTPSYCAWGAWARS